MKTLKFFFAVLISVLFFISAANAQGNKTKDCTTYSEAGYLVCNGDYVEGDITYCFTSWDSKFQFKMKGTLYGIDSGNTYVVNVIENHNMKPWKPGTAYNETIVANYNITCDGEPLQG